MTAPIAAMTEAEVQTRHDLAALYRLVAHFRMTDLIDTHISARIPGTPDHFLINRYGVLFHEMRPEDLVKIDPSGQAVDGAASQPGAPRRPGIGSRTSGPRGAHRAAY